MTLARRGVAGDLIIFIASVFCLWHPVFALAAARAGVQCDFYAIHTRSRSRPLSPQWHTAHNECNLAEDMFMLLVSGLLHMTHCDIANHTLES